MNTSERKTLLLMKVVSFGTICLILLALFFLSSHQQDKRSVQFIANTKINPLSKKLIKNINQFSWKNESFVQQLSNNKLNYINYWAQWCEPCLTEMPYLKQIAENHPNLNILFVNVDRAKDRHLAQKWWSANNHGFNGYYMSNENLILQHTRGLPYHQLYDLNNNLVAHFTGSIESKIKKFSTLISYLKSN